MGLLTSYTDSQSHLFRGFAISACSSDVVSVPYEPSFAEIVTAPGFWSQFETYLVLVVNLIGKGTVRASFHVLIQEGQFCNGQGMMLNMQG